MLLFLFVMHNSGVDKNLNSKLVLGTMIDLRKGSDYTIQQKGTIETHKDCLLHIDTWLTTKKYDAKKYRTWIIDGAMEGLGEELRARYNWASRVIVCFGHIYNRIYCNSFFKSELFVTNNKSITFIKNFIDDSNIRSMEFDLDLITYAFDSNDPIRFIANYDAGVGIIDNVPVLLKYAQYLTTKKEYQDYLQKHQQWKQQQQQWQTSQPTKPDTSNVSPQRKAALMGLFQSLVSIY